MRIGISGGTFDPVHKGHIESALAAGYVLGLDRVLFVPGGEPPHKLDRRVTPAADRVAMLSAALAPYENFSVCSYEVEKDAYSYSIDTIKYLIQTLGEDTELFFIIGADAVSELKYWKDYRELFSLCRFAVLMRPGYDREKFLRDIEENRREGARMDPVEGPLVDISSHKIRSLVQEGRTEEIAAYLPDGVRAYIETKKLYQSPMPFDEAYACSNMRRRLKPERYEHALRVSAEAEKIGRAFGIDPEKCRLSGLLHDCGKGVTESQLHWLAPELIALGRPENGGNPAIVHGPAGAVIARKKYGIMDAQILEAIRCHVTGAPDMGPVAQVVFIADYTEPGRQGEAFDRIRRALQNADKRPEGLYPVVVTACDESMKFVLNKGQILHKSVLETRNAFILKAEG